MAWLLPLLAFAGIGFIAQMIDGALGMAYGVTSNSILLAVGLPPALASASVHAAETFTTFVSGISHFKIGNVDRKLFVRLVVPGVAGGVVGAYLLSLETVGKFLKPYIAAYLLLMGGLIIYKAFRKAPAKEAHEPHFLIPLGAIGGFCDAIGGGGWGPVVTSTVVGRGHNPRLAVGSVNASEFFVTFAQSVTFILTIPHLFARWWIIVGLLLGGVVAAPLAAFACKKLPTRVLMVAVGCLIILLSIRTLLKTFGVPLL